MDAWTRARRNAKRYDARGRRKPKRALSPTKPTTTVDPGVRVALRKALGLAATPPSAIEAHPLLAGHGNTADNVARKEATQSQVVGTHRGSDFAAPLKDAPTGRTEAPASVVDPSQTARQAFQNADVYKREIPLERVVHVYEETPPEGYVIDCGGCDYSTTTHDDYESALAEYRGHRC